MKRISLTLSVLLATIALQHPASSQELDQNRADQMPFITGAGTRTCAQLAADYRLNPKVAEAMYGSWALGFIAALNMRRTIDKQPWRVVVPIGKEFNYIRSLCDTSPLATYYEILWDFFETIPEVPCSKKCQEIGSWLVARQKKIQSIVNRPRSGSANVKDASEERIKQRVSQIGDLISNACLNASIDNTTAILEKLKRGEISREQAVTQIDAIKVIVTNELWKELSDSSLTSFDANIAKTDDQIYWQALARCSRVGYDTIR